MSQNMVCVLGYALKSVTGNLSEEQRDSNKQHPHEVHGSMWGSNINLLVIICVEDLINMVVLGFVI